MHFTKQEQALIKLAAAHMAPRMAKKATLQDKLSEYGISMDKKASEQKPSEQLQQKLASYGVGLMKKAETYGQAFARLADKKLNNFGGWLDNAWKTVQMNAGKTPNQVNPPTSDEYQKGWEIYGPGPNRERGAMSSVPGSPLWEKTPEDYERDARDAKFQRRADLRFKKRQGIWDAKMRQRAFKRQQHDFNEFMDNAKHAPNATERDMYLRRMRLLPPRDEIDSLISDIWFPSSTGK